MKLKNKKTGVIGYPYFQNWKEITCVIVDENAKQIAEYTSLAELNEEWEDYEEAKEFYFIDQFMSVSKGVVDDVEYAGRHKAVNYAKKTSNNLKTAGNYFETKEEAEKAVERLRAWKRLKDKGFRFTLTPGVGSLDITPGKFQIEINADMPEKWFCCDAVEEDLDNCFGGEE